MWSNICVHHSVEKIGRHPSWEYIYKYLHIHCVLCWVKLDIICLLPHKPVHYWYFHWDAILIVRVKCLSNTGISFQLIWFIFWTINSYWSGGYLFVITYGWNVQLQSSAGYDDHVIRYELCAPSRSSLSCSVRCAIITLFIVFTCCKVSVDSHCN